MLVSMFIDITLHQLHHHHHHRIICRAPSSANTQDKSELFSHTATSSAVLSGRLSSNFCCRYYHHHPFSVCLVSANIYHRSHKRRNQSPTYTQKSKFASSQIDRVRVILECIGEYIGDLVYDEKSLSNLFH